MASLGMGNAGLASFEGTSPSLNTCHLSIPVENRDSTSWLKYRDELENSGGADFKVGFLNATSLKKHFWGLHQVLLNDPTYHLFGVAKTRLNESVDSNMVRT